MNTDRTPQISRSDIAVGIAVAALVALIALGSAAVFVHPTRMLPFNDGDDDDLVGSTLPVAAQPPAGSIVAGFPRISYAPDSTASLRLVSPPKGRLTLQVLHAGYGHEGPMRGAPVGKPWTQPAAAIAVRIGSWPSGLYYVRLTASAGRVGYAPFVVRPKRLGEQRVLVVLPTYTWQAYNFYDADRDGHGDSWYATPGVYSVDLTRPFIARGVPPHFNGYDRGFLQWLAATGKQVDFLADEDLEHVATGDALAAAYDLIVFSGHEEYVTTHIYDIAERYRDLGGNLAFLSANNFFYRVRRHGASIERDGRWRDLDRPEAGLVGAQYVDWYQQKYESRPYVVVGASQARWFFAESGLRNGSRFGRYGIEIDAPGSDSPPGTITLATIRDIFGPGKTAAMTYYTTPRGAKVFDAGVMNFGGSAMWPAVKPLMANLWSELSKP